MENRVNEFLNNVENKGESELAIYLSNVFQIDEKNGLKSAKHFNESCQDNPDHTLKAHDFGKSILDESNMESLLLLQSCFGLDPFLSITALDAFRGFLKN